MVDSAIGWIEIHTVSSAQVGLVANQVKFAWLTHYPLSSKVIANRDNKLLAKFRVMIINDDGIKVRPII